MSDVCIAPTEETRETNYYASSGKPAPHCLPRYMRLSSFAGNPGARTILMGSNSCVRQDECPAEMMTPYDYARVNDLNKDMVYEVVTCYLCAGKRRSGKKYDVDLLKATVEKYGPPPGAVDASEATSICKMSMRPAPVWSLGKMKYFDPVECRKQREKYIERK